MHCIFLASNLVYMVTNNVEYIKNKIIILNKNYLPDTLLSECQNHKGNEANWQIPNFKTLLPFKFEYMKINKDINSKNTIFPVHYQDV